MIGEFFQKTFNMPVRLRVVRDVGNGQPVIFLHGIASNSNTWAQVLPLLSNLPVRAITIDMLGFGDSPKPDWVEYTVEDHIKSVAATIKKLKLRQKPIIVGHSMGSLIATGYAAQYPERVKRLVLCSIPLYVDDGDIEPEQSYKKYGHTLNDVYFKIYNKLIEKKSFTLRNAKKFEKLNREGDFTLDEETWLPFEKSLQNTIIKQRTISQLETIEVPVDIIYGKLDPLLLSKYFTALAATNKLIFVHSVAAAHSITPKYAAKIATILQIYIAN